MEEKNCRERSLEEIMQRLRDLDLREGHLDKSVGYGFSDIIYFKKPFNIDYLKDLVAKNIPEKYTDGGLCGSWWN